MKTVQNIFAAAYAATCGIRAKAGGALTLAFVLLSAAVGLLTVLLDLAESADDLKPPTGYRKWFHVNTMIVDKTSPLFNVLGGMHNVHVNSVGRIRAQERWAIPKGDHVLDRPA